MIRVGSQRHSKKNPFSTVFHVRKQEFASVSAWHMTLYCSEVLSVCVTWSILKDSGLQRFFLIFMDPCIVV